MPAASVSMEVVKEERKSMEVVRGGHLYKNGATPVASVTKELKKEEEVGRRSKEGNCRRSRLGHLCSHAAKL